ncbi:unnamed protein product [Urochloa humidicola]
MLAMENVDNCLAMVRDTEYEFLKELTAMMNNDDRYSCVVASLLRNMCLHASSELKDLDLEMLSHILAKVLKRTIDAEGEELEILIGLCSQICQLIPEDFARGLEDAQIKEIFLKRLVDALNASTLHSGHCPGLRRAILEQVVTMTEHDPRYANCFNDCGMVEALPMVEKTISKAENYRILLGDAGLMEFEEPLSSLVAKAKELLAVRAA